MSETCSLHPKTQKSNYLDNHPGKQVLEIFYFQTTFTAKTSESQKVLKKTQLPAPPNPGLYSLHPMQFHNQLTWKTIEVHALHTWNEKHQQLWNQRKIVAVSWLRRTHTYPLNKCNEYNVVQSPMQVVHEFGHASIDGHCPSYIRGKAHFVSASCLGQAFLRISTVHMTYLISIFHCLHFYPLFVLHFNFLDTCFSRASFHPSSFLDLSFFFFFFFPFFLRKHNNKPDPQAIGTPKSSTVAEDDGWQGFHLQHPHLSGLNFEPRIFFFWGPRVPDYRGLYNWAIYHLSWLSCFSIVF